MRRIVFISLLLLLPLPLRGQQNPAPQPRPKIGVALEGGGALGLAHIGVLKWFEEHHIPVDYVAGTSMGGLVGGFYATGMSPDELNTLIDGMDWRQILSDRTPYEDLAFRRKEDQRAYPNSLIFGLRDGLSLPAGLNAGHHIGLLIDRVTLPYDEVVNFDALPVPFRCVATDLVSRKSYVFKDGSLAVALRATMSIPGAFSPVHDGKAVFVDGGLLNNLPTDVVRQMGAEIVIAVHLERAPVEAKDIQSVFSVLDHSVRVVLEENELRSLAQADAVVSVPLADYRSVDYAKSEQIVRRGYEAANSRARLLEAFALDDADWQEHQRRRIEKNGQTGLLIQVVEKNYAPPMLQTAFEVDGSQSGNVDFTMGTRFTFMDVAGFRSEWRTDVLLGNTYGIRTELFRPFRAESRWFFAPHADASDTTFQIYAKNDPLADYRIYRINIGGDLGYSFGRSSELRVGYEVGSLNTKLRLGSPEIPSVEGRVGQTRLRYLLDHTDDPVIPRRGFSAETNFRWFDQSPGAKGGFPSMDLKLGYFQPIARPASLFLEGEGGTTFGNSNPGVPQFFLGGPQRLHNYGPNQLPANQP